MEAQLNQGRTDMRVFQEIVRTWMLIHHVVPVYVSGFHFFPPSGYLHSGESFSPWLCFPYSHHIHLSDALSALEGFQCLSQPPTYHEQTTG